jgi:hypothetical protein
MNKTPHINQLDDFSKVIQKTLQNPTVVLHIKESAWNFMNDRTDNNLEIRGRLARYAGKMCELCVQNISHISKPDFDDKLRKYKFRNECDSITPLNWLNDNIPVYAQQLEEDLPWKIMVKNSNLQYFLAKILCTTVQIFFANYYDFDYRKLLMSEEAFLDKILKEKNWKQVIVSLSGDVLEDQKIIKKTVQEIESILNQERAKLN